MIEHNKILTSAEIADREINEASAFNEEVLRELGIQNIEELKDEQLVLPEERIRMHLNFTKAPATPYRFALYQLQNLPNKRVLDYCAGTGATTVIIAKKEPRAIEAFDISQLAVEVAKRRMVANSVGHLVNYSNMSAYSMTYPDNYFDVVFGMDALHHLDIELALKGILRVLKPGGMAVFSEPFAGSAMLQAIRKLIPIKAFVSDDERQLVPQDIEYMKANFSAATVRFMGLLSRLDRIVKQPHVIRLLQWVDAFLLDRFSPIRRYAREFVIVLYK